MTPAAWGLRLGAWRTLAVCSFALAAGGVGVGACVGDLAARASGNPQVSRPARIISLIPATTEMLFAMGAGDQVAGVSSFDTYPPEATTRTRVGALLNPDFERILSLKPDLVVVYATQTDLAARLTRAGVPTFAYRHTGLADISTTIASLGERVGRIEEATRLVGDVQRGLEEVRQSVAGRPRPRVALVFGREAGTLRSIFVSGGVGFLHDLLETAGGENAFDDVKRESIQISAEAMLAHAPDIIIEMHPSNWDTSATAREQAVWRGLPGLPAVRANRIHIIADDRLLIPGPRIRHAARLLAETIHPGVRLR
jgi:iron complex transport system substrate-binding protein